MFKRFLVVVLSCMMMTAPIVAFAEAEGVIPEAEQTIEASEPVIETEPVDEEDSALEEEPQEEEDILQEVESTSEPGINQEETTRPAIQPRVPASDYPLKAIYPMVLTSTDDKNPTKTEIISTGAGGGVGVANTTYETKQLHYAGELILSVKQIGNLGSGLIVAAEGSTIWGAPGHADTIDPGTGAVTSWTHEYTFSKIDSDISRLVINLTAIPVQISIQEPRRRAIIVNFDDGRGAAPQTPAFAISDSNPNKYALKGVDASMEYRLKTGGAWTTCTDGEILFDIPTKTVSYYVRNKATDTEKESQVKEISIYPVPTAPIVSYGTTSETFTGLTTAMEISMNDSPYIPVTDEIIAAGVAPYIDAVETSTGSLKIRKQATDTSPVSRVKEIILYPRSVMTRFPTLDPYTYRMTIEGAGYQYRTEGGNWNSTSSTTTLLRCESAAKEDRESYIEVRVAPTKTKSASLPTRYILKQLSPQIEGLTLDYAGQAIAGFDINKGYQYRKYATESWTSAKITDGKFSLLSFLDTVTSLEFRTISTSSTTPGAPTKVIFSNRPAPPTTARFVYNISNDVTTANLVDVTEDMEYRDATISKDEWKACSTEGIQNEMIMPPVEKSCYVRYKATDSKFPSKIQTVKVRGLSAAPACTLNTTTEIISGLTSKMFYSINGGQYVKVGTEKTLNVVELIDSVPVGGNATIIIKALPTELAPASKETIFTLAARQAVPTGLVFDSATKQITGLQTSMQYRETGPEAWKDITTYKMTFTSLINGRPNVSVDVRFKKGTKGSASKPTVVNLY